MTSWGDVITRVRGLATHFFSREALMRLTTATDRAALVEGMTRAQFGIDVSIGVTDAELESGVRRAATRHLHLVTRWSGSRTAILDAVNADLDRTIVRQQIRGALEGASPAARTAGLSPTVAFPARSLDRLAQQPTPAAVAAFLVEIGDPRGATLAPLTISARPDLFAIDVALDHAFATRALCAAKQGDRTLRTWVRRRIGLDNACAALAFAGSGGHPPEGTFLDGGVPKDAPLDRAARADDRAAAATALAAAFADSPVATAFDDVELGLARFTAAARAALTEDLVRTARLAPLSTAPILVFFARLEAQVRDLSRIIWGRALGVPARLIQAELATP